MQAQVKAAYNPPDFRGAGGNQPTAGHIDGQLPPVVPAQPVQPVNRTDLDYDSEMETGHNSIYPPNFKGTTCEDAEAWLRHFNNYCAYRAFTDDKTKALFRVMLVDSAAVWFDSLTQAIGDDWEALKREFLKRYTTPEFLKYKHANDLFNCKQEMRSVDDYTAFMQKLASQIGAQDDILRYAVINGLRPEIKNHVTMQQPTTWEALVQAARVGEMCSPVVTQSDPSLAMQVQLMRDQLNQLVSEKRVAMLDEFNRLRGQGQTYSRSSSEKRVRFNIDSDCENERGRSLSPVSCRRGDRRDGRDDRRGDGCSGGRRKDRRGDWRGRWDDDSPRRGDWSDSGVRSAIERGRSVQRNYCDYTAAAVSPDRFYGYREAPTPQFYPLQPSRNDWRQEQAPQRGQASQWGQPPQFGQSWGRGRGQPRGGARGNFRGNAPRGYPRGSFRGRNELSSFPNQTDDGSCFKCGGRRHDHLNMCPAINQFCRGCGRKGHFLRVCRSTGASAPSERWLKPRPVKGRDTRRTRNCNLGVDPTDGNYVVLRVGRQSAEALVDSGASCSTMSKSCAQQLKLDIIPYWGPPERVRSANGTRIHTLGTVKIELYLQGGIRIDHEVWVAEELNPNFILGMNFLLDNQVKLNFATKPPTMTLFDDLFDIPLRPRCDMNNGAFLHHTAVLPPYSEAYVTVNTPNNFNNSNVLLEDAHRMDAISVAGALAFCKDNKAICKVLNLNPYVVTLKKGLKLAKVLDFGKIASIQKCESDLSLIHI